MLPKSRDWRQTPTSAVGPLHLLPQPLIFRALVAERLLPPLSYSHRSWWPSLYLVAANSRNGRHTQPHWISLFRQGIGPHILAGPSGWLSTAENAASPLKDGAHQLIGCSIQRDTGRRSQYLPPAPGCSAESAPWKAS